MPKWASKSLPKPVQTHPSSHQATHSCTHPSPPTHSSGTHSAFKVIKTLLPEHFLGQLEFQSNDLPCDFSLRSQSKQPKPCFLSISLASWNFKVTTYPVIFRSDRCPSSQNPASRKGCGRCRFTLVMPRCKVAAEVRSRGGTSVLELSAGDQRWSSALELSAGARR